MDTSAIAIPADARAAFEAEHELVAARYRAEREREIAHQSKGGGRWWMSFIVTQGELSWTGSPSWISGYAESGPTVVMAVVADSEEEAETHVLTQLPEGVEIEWRFSEEKDGDFSPHPGGRFPLDEHSIWPGHPLSPMEKFLSDLYADELESFEYEYRRAAELKTLSIREVVERAVASLDFIEDEEWAGDTVETVLEYLVKAERVAPEDAL